MRSGARRRKSIAVEMLDKVGIANPSLRVDQFPHEMSGGMRQRAMIALALSTRPSLLIADEPTTALDVTIQAQILELMRDLQAEFGMSIVFITHDMGVISQIADDVAVMYLGRIAESGTTRGRGVQSSAPVFPGLDRCHPQARSPGPAPGPGAREIFRARSIGRPAAHSIPAAHARSRGGAISRCRGITRIDGRASGELPPPCRTDSVMSEHPLIRIEDLKVHFPIRGKGLFERGCRTGQGGRRRQLRHTQGGNRRPGWRVGLGQDDDRPGRAASRGAHRWKNHVPAQR